jgi:cellulose synthase/poly-beta-1,6-N-acetylglucosamine synthase-like glycosyltransferase
MIEWIAATFAVFYSLGSLGLALLFAGHLRIPDDQPSARVTLVLPATGPLPGLEHLLDALAAQSLRPYRLIVAVESREDPAHRRVAALAERYPQLNIELVVAGLSPLRAQKCTNLLAALARLDADDEHVVLLDADIRPQPWWLAALVAPLAAGRADVVNGYRWPMPNKLSLATALVAWIDRSIAVLPSLSLARTIWGGSLALTRQAIETLDLPTTRRRTRARGPPSSSTAPAARSRPMRSSGSGFDIRARATGSVATADRSPGYLPASCTSILIIGDKAATSLVTAWRR